MHRFCSLSVLSRRLCKTKNHCLVGRSKPRPYSAYFQHNTPQKTPFGRRVAPWCDRAGVWKPIGLSPRCKLGPQPCRRYGCGGCLGETAIMGNPTFSLGGLTWGQSCGVDNRASEMLGCDIDSGRPIRDPTPTTRGTSDSITPRCKLGELAALG